MALADVISAEQRCVAILPDMKFASGNGISIKNPVSGYELWLDGSVDYAVTVLSMMIRVIPRVSRITIQIGC